MYLLGMLSSEQEALEMSLATVCSELSQSCFHVHFYGFQQLSLYMVDC